MENAQESGHNHGNTNILFLEREFFYFILFAKTAHFSGREWIRSNFRLTDEAQTLVFRFRYFYTCTHSPPGSC